MKTAIISVTRSGAELGQKVKQQLLRLASAGDYIHSYEKEGRESHGKICQVGTSKDHTSRADLSQDCMDQDNSLKAHISNGPIGKDNAVKAYMNEDYISQTRANISDNISDKNGVTTFSSLSSLMKDLMGQYDRLLFIMATGIVVRMIAPYIKHKSVDPAVVVMDEQGQFAISLLSGHLGGANEWTAELAQLVSATPVITTATDVNGLPAPDVLARKLSAAVEDFSVLKEVNAAIVAKEIVPYYLDDTLYFSSYYKKLAKEMGIAVQCFNPLTVTGRAACGNLDAAQVVITDLVIPRGPRTLVLRPKSITLGIGCRRGTSADYIKAAILDALESIGRSLYSVQSIGSVTVKSDEIGLLQAARELNIPIHFHTPEAIEYIIESQGLEESKFVKETIGVGNVCETTALLEAKSQTLLLKKTKYQGITIAIAQVQSK